MSGQLRDRVPHHLAYRRSRESITGLLDARRERHGVPVPACPGWTVGHVVAHLVAICSGVVAGERSRLWEIPSGEADDLGALLAQWTELDGAVERLFREDQGIQRAIMTMDCFTHELDIRRALDEPVVEDHPSYPLSLDLVVRGFTAAVRSHGLPAVRLESTSGDGWVAGDGTPGSIVRGHHHDLLRSLTGRRTATQIRALDWEGPPDPWLPAFDWGPFRVPDTATEAATEPV